MRWFHCEPGDAALAVREEPRLRWVELTPLIRVDERVALVVDAESIKEEVTRIIDAHRAPITRVEVMPHQWTWDENFLSVKAQFWTDTGPFAQLYTLGQRTKIILKPFHGYDRI